MKVWIMCGLPGSGKSTVVRKIKNSNQDVVIVSQDSIREMLYGEYAYVAIDEIMVKHMALQLYFQTLKFEKNLIIDATSLTKETRSDIMVELQAVTQDNIKFEIVFCEHSNALENRLDDPRGIPEIAWREIFRSMEISLEVPECDECQISYYGDFDHKITLPRINNESPR